MARGTSYGSRWFWVARWVMSLGAGTFVGWLWWSAWYESAAANQPTMPAAIVTTAQEALEREWVAQALPSVDFIARVSSPPCFAQPEAPVSRARDEVKAALNRQDVGGAIGDLKHLYAAAKGEWAVGLALASKQAAAGQWQQADEVLDEVLGLPAIAGAVVEIRDAAREQRATRGVDAAIMSASLHANFMSGTVKLHLEQPDLAIVPLRRSIAATKALASMASGGRRQPGWANLPRHPPGCSETEKTPLTSLDLWNNLVVAYLDSEKFEVEADQLSSETTRVGEPTVFTALMDEFAKGADRRDRMIAYAFSNIDEGLSAAADAPASRYFSGTAARMLEEHAGRIPRSRVNDAEAWMDRLLAVATDGHVEDSDFAKAVAKLRALRASRARDVALLDDVAESRDGTEDIIRCLRFTIGESSKAIEWLKGERIPPEVMVDATHKLGPAQAELWARAVQLDFLTSLLPQSDKLDPRLVHKARYWLPKDVDPPEGLQRAEAALASEPWKTTLGRMLRPYFAWLAVLFGAGTAALGGKLGAWLETQLDHRRALFTSFYRIEVLELADKRRRSGQR